MTTDFSAQTATGAVVSSFAATPDSRLRSVLESLARYLHEFVREVRPSVDEWSEAIGFLTQVGQTCSETRQEFILLSDVLGVSMLVETINGQDVGTESTVLGPFHMTTSPERQLGDYLGRPEGERRCVVSGRVLSTNGDPLAGAVIDVWQCDEDGFYDVQQPETQLPGTGRGLFRADADGRFWFRTVVPSHYPIPTDGPVGRLLDATRRHPYRPAHIHFMARADGYRELTTHAFVGDGPYIDSDAVFAVKESLIVNFRECTDTEAAAGFSVSVPFTHALFDIMLQEA